MSERMPPEALYLGLENGTWPVHSFVAEAHAISWLGTDPGRQIWRVKVTEPVRMKLVQREAYLEPDVPGDDQA